ncbi:hypothetical protein AbraCBS73388_001627 [Aspergillus brasiliensis]|uniref:Alpha/beta hydrolase fold-3 domain-containing protein n=1 Tax=Aspergillus brasiliensis TaxID=319629 RepID=A0A9W5Z0F3_9EURO|nr:hypothetical protein AbraCBS73388_001627 [Aspergillus brasiliensis]
MDFSQYTGPSEEWLALEATLPPPPADLPNEQLKAVNNTRCDGFVFGTLSSEDAACAQVVTTLAEQGTLVVVANVNHRHTPGHEYPVAWNDTEDPFSWIHDLVDELGGDSERLIIGAAADEASQPKRFELGHKLGRACAYAAK